MIPAYSAVIICALSVTIRNVICHHSLLLLDHCPLRQSTTVLAQVLARMVAKVLARVVAKVLAEVVAEVVAEVGIR